MRQQQSNISTLTHVSVRDTLCAHIDDDLKEICPCRKASHYPHPSLRPDPISIAPSQFPSPSLIRSSCLGIIELDLEGCLFVDWAEIEKLCQSLPLVEVRLSRNHFISPIPDPSRFVEPFSTIRTLHMNHVPFAWNHVRSQNTIAITSSCSPFYMPSTST